MFGIYGMLVKLNRKYVNHKSVKSFQVWHFY